MKCEAARPLLGPYLDGELDRAVVDELEAHLSTCAACRTELASLEQLRGALRGMPRHRAPEDLRRRILEARQTAEVGVVARRPRAQLWWGLAASLLLGVAIGVGGTLWHRAGSRVLGPSDLLARDLVGSHLRALAASSAVDVVSEDRHTVKPWFAGKIGESPPVIDPKSGDFPLLGGRIDYVGEQRTAVIVYGHRKHIIDVYIAPGADHNDAQMRQVQGFTLTPCTLGGQSAWIVSDIDEDSLDHFSELIGCGG